MIIQMTLSDGTGGCVEISDSYNGLSYIEKPAEIEPECVKQFCNNKG